MLRTMKRAHNRRKSFSPSRPFAKRNARQLLMERLEQRHLLTTVLITDPLPNSHDAPTTTDVTATFDEVITGATATTQSFSVHSMLRGQLTGGAATVTAADQTVTLDPATNFSPGEKVQATATAGIQGAATAVVPQVWQFRIGVTAGSGQFVETGQNISPSSTSAAQGDFDGDGDLDIFLGNSGANSVWANDGSGVFTSVQQGLGSGNSRGTEAGDLDGDGDLDIFTANRGTANGVWMNGGNGQFSGGQTLGNSGSYDVSLGDVDGDGDLDAFVANAFQANRVWVNNGSGSFADSGQTLGNFGSQGVELGDLDGDGDLDAYVANAFQGNQVWTNDGTGTFASSGQSLGNHNSQDISLGDVDGDGDLDAFVTQYAQGSRVWINDGSGSFSNSGPLPGTLRGRGTALGDMDGDGDLDAFVANDFPHGNLVWVNDGSGGFTDSGQSLNGHRSYHATLGDLDGDGDLDVFSANYGEYSSVYLNQNLQPNVTLSVDASTIVEAGGIATVAATLSAAHTAEVTIDLGISGTATATDDYTVSGSQIVIPVGATSGSIAITAVQDNEDEPDETVLVDIANVTNAQEAGTQQVSTTILDDDEAVVVPDVVLSVDNATIPEEAGVATFIATLSAVTTLPVTIDLGISGTATAGDFNVSGTQIVVAPGATTGSITVTAVQDVVDEADETVVVDITNVTGGNELATQQQTTTIADDDEPPVPDVTLAVDTAEIAEAGGVATFLVTLSEVTTLPVTVDLEITGSAGAGDYTTSGTQIVVAPGATTGAVTVTAVDDTEDESDESVIVDIAAVANGNEAGEQQQTTTITDDDDPPKLTVTSLTSTASGFTAQFSTDLNASVLNLYDTQTAGLGPADAMLVGTASGPVPGSLVIDPALRAVTFIKSGGPLAEDIYTVTLRSSTDGFVDLSGQLLDGNNDGTDGDDHTSTFEVTAAPANAVTIGIPDIVRGPGQDINLPPDESNGIPVTISEGTNVRAVDLRIGYDPNLLSITGATVGADAPGGASVIANTTTPGLAILVFFSTNPLPAGSANFVNLQATVPATDPSGIYGAQQVLDVHGAIVSDGNDNESPVVEDDAFHLSSFFADVSGNGRINAADASQVARFAALIDTGFLGAPNADPIIVGDVSGNGRLNAADASLLAQFAALIDVPQIPAIPGGIVITGEALARPILSEQGDRHPSIELPSAIEVGSELDLGWAHHAAIDQVLTDLETSADDEDALPALEDAIDALLVSTLD